MRGQQVFDEPLQRILVGRCRCPNVTLEPTGVRQQMADRDISAGEEFSGFSQTDPYTLTVTAGNFTDRFEPNHTSNSAARLGAHAYQAKMYTATDVDWYQFGLSASDTVTLTLASPPGVQLRLTVSDGAGSFGGSIFQSNAGSTSTLPMSPWPACKTSDQSLSSTTSTTDDYTLTLASPRVVEPPTEPCTFAVSPSSFVRSSAAFTGSVSVVASDLRCTWMATELVSSLQLWSRPAASAAAHSGSRWTRTSRRTRRDAPYHSHRQCDRVDFTGPADQPHRGPNGAAVRRDANQRRRGLHNGDA